MRRPSISPWRNENRRIRHNQYPGDNSWQRDKPRRYCWRGELNRSIHCLVSHGQRGHGSLCSDSLQYAICLIFLFQCKRFFHQLSSFAINTNNGFIYCGKYLGIRPTYCLSDLFWILYTEQKLTFYAIVSLRWLREVRSRSFIKSIQYSHAHKQYIWNWV